MLEKSQLKQSTPPLLPTQQSDITKRVVMLARPYSCRSKCRTNQSSIYSKRGIAFGQIEVGAFLLWYRLFPRQCRNSHPAVTSTSPSVGRQLCSFRTSHDKDLVSTISLPGARRNYFTLWSGYHELQRRKYSGPALLR